ncbi:heavy metal-associated isoprenylated plant protein 41-like [Hibiscus syriacus]|uniref:heavy metal-associated isoprenylated plant protein 41-like n=1 Tax=Hibiscus syriacus TaxID=106335 RepID=UPI0019205617|nr:heavy metal-associated isoprenylated plant protein 41-like [Hibiscus syriacus]
MATREPMNEKWITHYSSNHQILLVGEGDFSFSLSLANAFASASNICATSLDSYDDLKKYKNAASNLEKLSRLGATLLHRVNVATMKLHPVLANRKFDRIIFNFPHAGFKGKEDNPDMIGYRKHRDLVQHFFWNARRMLRVDGEIHVNHKTGPPYCLWNLKELADASFLALIQCVDFNIEDYPGYRNKRGDGPNCDAPFRLGKSCTLKFGVCPRAEKAAKATRRPMQPTSGFNYPQRNLVVNHIPSNHGWPPTIPSGNQFSEVLDRNLLLVRKYGRDSNGVETNRGRILRL